MNKIEKEAAKAVALQLLEASLQAATLCGLLDDLAADTKSADAINDFCDAVTHAAAATSQASALREFIDTVNTTGGIQKEDNGCVTPVADEDWPDLGDAYLNACAALGVPPKFQE